MAVTQPRWLDEREERALRAYRTMQARLAQDLGRVDVSDPDYAVLSTVSDKAQHRSQLRDAAPHHVASVREHFLDLLADEELDTLTDISERVLGRLIEPEPARTAGQ